MHRRCCFENRPCVPATCEPILSMPRIARPVAGTSARVLAHVYLFSVAFEVRAGHRARFSADRGIIHLATGRELDRDETARRDAGKWLLQCLHCTSDRRIWHAADTWTRSGRWTTGSGTALAYYLGTSPRPQCTVAARQGALRACSLCCSLRRLLIFKLFDR